MLLFFMNGSLTEILKNSRSQFCPVVPFTAGKDKLCAMDLTARNTSLSSHILDDIDMFTAYINDELKKNNARYGIGGYDELREVYAASTVFDGSEGNAPRRLHLGTDIWGKHYTPVMAPLPGIIHSYKFNNRKGDYGATIILTHNLQQFSFYTLYGHLSLSSISDIEEGRRIDAGEIFAEFGIPSENGQWPPHLHFQLIIDIGEWKGDYPGVCAEQEKKKWLSNSPDPDLVLGMNKYV
jgi:peptidoglycan LD-endopeptidase LytH